MTTRDVCRCEEFTDEAIYCDSLRHYATTYSEAANGDCFVSLAMTGTGILHGDTPDRIDGC